MKFIYSDGGRSKYFKTEKVGDCVTRAIANATGKDYLEIYKDLNKMAKFENTTKHREHKISSSRNGVFRETWKQYLKDLGWIYHSSKINGRWLKLTESDLPSGNLIIQISKHLTNVKDKVLYDTYDCSIKKYWQDGILLENTERAIYGYWT